MFVYAVIGCFVIAVVEAGGIGGIGGLGGGFFVFGLKASDGFELGGEEFLGWFDGDFDLRGLSGLGVWFGALRVGDGGFVVGEDGAFGAAVGRLGNHGGRASSVGILAVVDG